MEAQKICIVGASGKLGQYMVELALNEGYQVVGVCREKSRHKLDRFRDRIKVYGGATDDADVIRQATEGCVAVLTVLVPWGVHGYSLGTARAVLEQSPPDARLVFSCGWHISQDGQDQYDWKMRALVTLVSPLARWLRLVDVEDQVRATNLIFQSQRKWTVVRGSDLEEGESEGLPVWAKHVGDPILASNRTRRIDFALFMVKAIDNDALIHQSPAIVSCQSGKQ